MRPARHRRLRRIAAATRHDRSGAALGAGGERARRPCARRARRRSLARRARAGGGKGRPCRRPGQRRRARAPAEAKRRPPGAGPDDSDRRRRRRRRTIGRGRPGLRLRVLLVCSSASAGPHGRGRHWRVRRRPHFAPPRGGYRAIISPAPSSVNDWLEPARRTPPCRLQVGQVALCSRNAGTTGSGSCVRSRAKHESVMPGTRRGRRSAHGSSAASIWRLHLGVADEVLDGRLVDHLNGPGPRPTVRQAS